MKYFSTRAQYAYAELSPTPIEHEDDLHLYEMQNHTQPICKQQKRYIPRCRWILTGILICGYMTAHILRFCLGVAIVAMVKIRANESEESNETDSCVTVDNETYHHRKMEEGDLDWSLHEQNLVLGAMSYGYIVSNILGGRIVELVGVRWSFGGSLFVTSVLTVLTPLLASLSYVALLVARIIEGLAQGLVVPSVPVFLSRWIPSAERTTVYALVHAGGSIGTVVSFALTGYLSYDAHVGGWPTAFYLYGSFGLLMCFVWTILTSEYPERNKWISRDELAYILHETNGDYHLRVTKDLPWKSICMSVPVWTCAFVLFGSLWGSNLVHEEQPTFLKNIFHFSLSTNGFLSALPSLSNVVIVSVAAVISDWISSKNVISDTNLRKIFVALGSFLPALCMVGVSLSGCDRYAVELFLILSVGFLAFITLGVLVAIVNMAPEFSGTITGICNGIAHASGFLAPLTVGYIMNEKQTLQKWHQVFYIAAAIYAAPGILFLFSGSSKPQPWA